MNEQTDAELAAQAAAGNRDAFAGLVERHARIVHAVALARTGDADAADEVAQRALVKAFCSIASLRDPERVRGWLLSIVRTSAIDWHREKRRLPVVSDQPDLIAVAPDPVRDPDESSKTEQVLGALDSAPEIYREPIVLHYLEGMPYAAIAETLGVERTTVRSRIYEGKRWLRRKLGAGFEEVDR